MEADVSVETDAGVEAIIELIKQGAPVKVFLKKDNTLVEIES